MEAPGGRSRVARRQQRIRDRKRARARRAAVAAGIAGLVVIAGMLGVALSISHSSARALTADRSAEAGQSTPASAGPTGSSPATSAGDSSSSAAASGTASSTSAAGAGSSPDPQSAAPAPTTSSPGADAAATTAAGPGSAVDTPEQPVSSPSGQAFGGTPAAGVLYRTDSGVASHFCSASVVHSPAGNLVITAGHCVYSDGPKQHIAFAPGYHNGQTPYGSWTVTKVVVSDAWQSGHDPDQDVAFLQVAASDSGASLESVTGADQIAFDRGFGMPVTVPAYPQGSDTPITCAAPALRHSATQTEWDCRGYPDGTSGAPFLVDVDGSGEKGTVIGVIGGYQRGGLTPDVSYSCYFGAAIQALYQSATV
ncbi:MAG: trypsin-like serine protease [Catenulisporales bacterium]|nr:trypsin-like serine protease [Catenulisporales bacterium]